MKKAIVVLVLLLLVEAVVIFNPLFRSGEQIDVPRLEFKQIDKQKRQVLEMIYKDAVNQYRRSLSIREALRIADMLLCYGYHLEAADMYRIILLREQRPRAWHGLGLCLDSLGQLKEARHAYGVFAAFELKNDVGQQNQHRLGELSLILNDVETARQIFENNKQHVPSRYRFIRILLREGDYELARQEFKKMLEYPEAQEAIESMQLNDLSLRLCGKILEELPQRPRTSRLSYQPIDIFKRGMESYYGMSMMELFTPALREMPQMMHELDVEAEIDFWTLLEDEEAIQRGQAVYKNNNCVICHGADAFGQTGPNLRDDYWLGRASPAGIYETITYGRRGGSMPGHQFSLRPDQIRDVTVYLVQLNLQTTLVEAAIGRPAEGRLLKLSRPAK